MTSYIDIEDYYPDRPGQYAVLIEDLTLDSREAVASWDGDTFSAPHLKDTEYITSWKPLSL